MSSQYIRKAEPKNRPEDRIQVVDALIAGAIVPIYGTDARNDKNLPKIIERKWGNKFFVNEGGTKKLVGEGWLETEEEFRARIEKLSEAYDRCHVRFKYKSTHIQHFKV